MLRTIFTLVLAASAAGVHAQDKVFAAPPRPQARVDPAQAEFEMSVGEFQARQYSEALAGFKHLVAQYPADDSYKKFAAEAALDCGQAAYVLATMPAVEVAHPEDWQTRLLLARAYQQTANVSGHPKMRDEEIAAVSRLHKAGDHPNLAKLHDFLLETVPQGGKIIQFYPAFEPWGPYQVSLTAQIYDASGKPGILLTLESGDADQPNFALQHPAEAAVGDREYTLDGYAPAHQDATGRTLQTHYTYHFFAGKPSYDVVRERILAIAAENASPLSGRTSPVN